MKAYIQSVIVALSLIGIPAHGVCAPVMPDLKMDSLVQEAMNQIVEEIKSDIPGEVAKLQRILMESLSTSQEKAGMSATEQSTDTTEE